MSVDLLTSKIICLAAKHDKKELDVMRDFLTVVDSQRQYAKRMHKPYCCNENYILKCLNKGYKRQSKED